MVQVPPMPADETRSVIRQELGGRPLHTFFEWIDLEQPLGSASISQVSSSFFRPDLCITFHVKVMLSHMHKMGRSNHG
jgi:ABC1 atypical kinase-like domain